jgi:hypothetical protein
MPEPGVSYRAALGMGPLSTTGMSAVLHLYAGAGNGLVIVVTVIAAVATGLVAVAPCLPALVSELSKAAVRRAAVAGKISTADATALINGESRGPVSTAAPPVGETHGPGVPAPRAQSTGSPESSPADEQSAGPPVGPTPLTV